MAATPVHGTPVHGTPVHGTPVHGAHIEGPALAATVQVFDECEEDYEEDLELVETKEAEDVWLSGPHHAPMADVIDLRRRVAQLELQKQQQDTEKKEEARWAQLEGKLEEHATQLALHTATLKHHAEGIAASLNAQCRLETSDLARRQRLAEVAAARRLEGAALRALVAEASLGLLSQRVFAEVAEDATIMAGLRRPAATDPSKHKVWSEQENRLLAVLVALGADDVVAGGWLLVDKKRVCRQRAALGLGTSHHFGGMRGDPPATPKKAEKRPTPAATPSSSAKKRR
eukprot:EG_transcript_20799